MLVYVWYVHSVHAHTHTHTHTVGKGDVSINLHRPSAEF